VTADDDELARRESAERLRDAVRKVESGGRRPRTPREFTEERAREAAAEERARIEGSDDDEGAGDDQGAGDDEDDG
jgi:hypothetical protein